MTKGKCGKCQYGKGGRASARCTIYESDPKDLAFIWRPDWKCPYFSPKKQDVAKENK